MTIATASIDGGITALISICIDCISLARFCDKVLQPFQTYRQMRAALGARHCMNLIDDHRIDSAENPPCLRSEQQIQRFWRGNEDIRWMGGYASPLLCGGVA